MSRRNGVSAEPSRAGWMRRGRVRSGSLRSGLLASGLMVLAASSGGALSGCAFEPGHGFGVVDAAVGARLEQPEARLVDGALKTDLSYAVALDALTLEVDTVRLISPATATGDTGFDPANPPPGYSLCHGGHCHSDDGGLVSYEEIEAELAGGGAAGPTVFLELPVGRTFDLLADGTPVPAPECLPDCEVDEGRVDRVAFVARRLRAEGTLRDASAQDRLAGETLDLIVDLQLAGLPLTAQLPEPVAFERGEAPYAELDLVLVVGPQLFDGIEFGFIPAAGTLEITEDLAEGEAPFVVETLVEHLSEAEVEVEVRRADRW